MPTLALLGPVLLDAEPLPDHLTTHLLVLLALHPTGLPRAQAAARLWPALAPEVAARNLRKTLHRLRAEGHAALWTEAGGRLRLAVPCDLAEAERRAPADALPLHRGALADGLRDDAGWLAPARVAALALWRRTLLAALPALAPAVAEAELLRLRALDPHDEALARAHLDLLATAGRGDEHDRVRAAWVRAVADDLGVSIAPEPAAHGAPVPPPMAARGAATLVGRDDELALLRERLAEPGAWVALRGPGGIGKSRLAAAWAEHAALQGLAVWWWPLADAATPEAAFARLAVELDQDDARPAALAAALAARPSLLVADNAEHLLDAGFAERLAALRATAPGLRGLVTSRRSVDGVAELPLAALDVPDPADPAGAVLRSAAVRLFCDRARAADATFEPRAHAAALGRIARAAGGHALALELAALRVRHAAPAEIAAALEAGDGGLEPLFEGAWATLPPPLREGLAALAALPPGFDRAVAEAAAALRPSGFDALVARSLVEPPADGVAEGARWRLHPLLRLWLRQRHPAPQAAARAEAAVLAALDTRLAAAAHDHAATLAWVETEHALLAQAFRRAATQADAALLLRLTPALAASLDTRGRRHELQALLADAAATLASAPLAARAPVQAQRAVTAYRSGRFDEALLLAAGLERAPPAVRVMVAGVQGLVAWQRGDGRTALAHHQRALRLALTHGLETQVPVALNNLALVDIMASRHAQAEQRLRQCAERAEACGSHRVGVLARLNLGGALRGAGRAQAARAELQAALEMLRAHGLVSLEANVLLMLGPTLLDLGDLPALALLLPQLRRSAAHGEAALMIGVEMLSMLFHVRRGEPALAWPYARAAWNAAQAIGKQTQQLELAMHAAEAWVAEGDRATGLAWLAWMRGQPLVWQDNRAEADRLWARLAPGAAEAATAEASAAGLSLDDLGRAIEAAALR